MIQILYQFGDGFATLVISSMGLAIIFGMMGIINLAHGEFVMLGAMAAAAFCNMGIPYLPAIVLSTIVTGLLGLILDRLIICHLYKRVLDSVVVTWGISMILKQAASLWAGAMYGNNVPGIKSPFGKIVVGGMAMSVYKLVLIVVALVLVLAVYLVFMKTRFGLNSRATMQSNEIAASLGVNTNHIYAMTFMTGSALAGLAGALFAPMYSVGADFGSNYMMPSFVTVLVGGANPLIGTILAGGALGLVESVITRLTETLYGQIGMLFFAVVFIRFCPKGFSALVESIGQKKARRRSLKRNLG